MSVLDKQLMKLSCVPNFVYVDVVSSRHAVVCQVFIFHHVGWNMREAPLPVGTVHSLAPDDITYKIHFCCYMLISTF